MGNLNALFRKKRVRFSLLLAVLTLAIGGPISSGAAVQPAGAATTDYFLKLDGVLGESAVKGHEKEITVSSYAWANGKPGVQAPATNNNGNGTTKATISDLHVTMPVNQASPTIFTAAAIGKHFTTATLTARKAGAAPLDYFKLVLSDVTITSYTNGSDPVNGGVDQFDLHFSKISEQYTPQDALGAAKTPITGTFDVATNTVS